MLLESGIPSVTLETKCWEGDYRRILAPGRLRMLAAANLYPFSERLLMINNVKSPAKVQRLAEQAVRERWISRYVIVEEHAREALDFFHLDREAFGRGYVYSISELVSLYLCQSDYLLHFAGDCYPSAPYDWLPEAVAFLQEHPQVKVANLSWVCPDSPPLHEATEVHRDFYVGYGFSDQCYLVRTADFRQPIYAEKHEASARYPGYGGELFEKRVDSWMRNHEYLRATYRHGTYTHESHTPSLRNRLRQLAGRAKQRVRGSLSARAGTISAPKGSAISSPGKPV